MKVLVPTVPRVYQPNPASGATTQVTMKADMPWQRTVRVGKPRMQISGLGDDYQPAVDITQSDGGAAALPQAKPAQPAGFSWGGLIDDIAKVGTAAATAVVQKQLGPKLTTTQKLMPYTSAGGVNWVVVGGIAAVVGVGIFFMTRKGGKRRGRR